MSLVAELVVVGNRTWVSVFGRRGLLLVLGHLVWLREEFQSVVRTLPLAPFCTDVAKVDELIRVVGLLFLHRTWGFLKRQRLIVSGARC